MRVFSSQILALFVTACTVEGPASSRGVDSGSRPQPASEPAPAPAPEAAPAPAALTPESLPPDEAARVARLAASFEGRVCDADALAQLRALRERYGAAPALASALALAFERCDEREALAALMAETLPADAPPEQRLRLGAAWLRAARYEDAATVLVPLAEDQGPRSKAAWLAGFALFHAGRSDDALPWLERAREHAGGAAGSDAALLIGLARLHAGDTNTAIAELEAGRAQAPDNIALLAALSRAYGAAGRREDAEALSRATQAANEAVAAQEQVQLRLSSLAATLAQARGEGRLSDADEIIAQMLPLAPAQLRVDLLELRAALYDQAGKSAEADAARRERDALRDQEGSP